MTWWMWVLVAWALGCALVTFGWIVFMRPLREWEDERLERFGQD